MSRLSHPRLTSAAVSRAVLSLSHTPNYTDSFCELSKYPTIRCGAPTKRKQAAPVRPSTENGRLRPLLDGVNKSQGVTRCQPATDLDGLSSFLLECNAAFRIAGLQLWWSRHFTV